MSVIQVVQSVLWKIIECVKTHMVAIFVNVWLDITAADPMDYVMVR